MQITKNQIEPTKVELTIVADADFLNHVKDHVLEHFQNDLQVKGFRKGHAPKNLAEKYADPATLQTQFLNHAVNDLFVQAAEQENLRSVSQPEVEVTKFVPYDTLEIKATVEVVGKITLPDYTKLGIAKKTETVTDKDVQAVIDDLLRREATKKDVERAAKDGDETVIDFKGVDPKTKEAIAGASGTDYPLTLGSSTFIPGFEPQLIGLKSGQDKTFDITFPRDYGATALQGKKVQFSVTVKKVRELELPKLDDKFAAKVGPFKTVDELKKDIKEQLKVERNNQARRQFENDLLEALAKGTKADLPKSLIDSEIERMEDEERRNLTYRGMTWQEHLDQEGKTAEDHKEGLRESATLRVKSGLALGEVAEAEGIKISEAELNTQIDALKQQYNDKAMQSELDKPENRREIHNRILAEKALAKLSDYAAK